ncbi:MucR family transcriptional regulator [Mesorhizobium sp. SB112]|uniref:MucR family transcriptional regulator n=1 Tax=Mesorhizobium sp. SB112 TaxID=3151853 RepID=UPI0032651A0E
MTGKTATVSADLLVLTSEIVAAYVSNNPVPASDLPRLIGNVHAAIAGLSSGISGAQPEEKPVPAVSIRKSVTPKVEQHTAAALRQSFRWKSL